jgi:hypothetical protein
MSLIEHFLCGITIVSIIFLLVLLSVLPVTEEQENRFMQECIAKGGVPSKYSTMVGKTSRSERLCIKKESIVEVGE